MKYYYTRLLLLMPERRSMPVNKNLYICILSGIILAALPSCSPIVNSIYGIKKVQAVTAGQIQAYTKSKGIRQAYFIDSSFDAYIHRLRTRHEIEDSEFLTLKKDLYQPIQLFVFSADNKLVAYFANCYAGGFPNLAWNKNQEFATVPPRTLTAPSAYIRLQDIVSYFKPVQEDSRSDTLFKGYTYVLMGNFFMKRQSERLLKLVLESTKTRSDVQLIYVNNDNRYLQKTVNNTLL